jgi:hypothetical protein
MAEGKQRLTQNRGLSGTASIDRASCLPVQLD